MMCPLLFRYLYLKNDRIFFLWNSYQHIAFVLKDDVLLFDYNIQERVNAFVAAALAQVWYKKGLFILSKCLLYAGF